MHFMTNRKHFWCCVVAIKSDFFFFLVIMSQGLCECVCAGRLIIKGGIRDTCPLRRDSGDWVVWAGRFLDSLRRSADKRNLRWEEQMEDGGI